MRRIIALLLMIFATGTARAQSDMSDFKLVLEKFLGEQRVFLNCSALDSQLHGIVLGQFEDMVKATFDLLRTYGTLADRADFEAKTALNAMLMREHRFGEVIDLCNKNLSWQQDIYQFRIIVLQNEASRIFYFRHHPGEQPK